MKRHYIYRMKNTQTGEFYIGKRSCNGEPSADVLYKGSGVVIKNKVKAHPEQWVKEILCFAASPEQLNQAERWAVGSQWMDNPLCLNLCPGGEGRSAWTEEQRAAMSENKKKFYESEEERAAQRERTKKYFESEEVRAFSSAQQKQIQGTPEVRAARSSRMKRYWQSEQNRSALSDTKKELMKVRMTSPQQERIEVSRTLLLDYLRAGYTFTRGHIWIQNDLLRQVCNYNSKKAPALLLSDCGWVYGSNRAYTQVGMAQVDAEKKIILT